MKTLKWILIVILVIVILFFILLAYMGMIFPLKTYESKMGPYTVIYESYVGPYSQTGPVFAKVYAALKADGIEATKGLGIYYDNPANTPAEKLRSDCGVIIKKKGFMTFYKVINKYKIKNIPEKDCLVVEFPLRNMFSYMFGPMRCYGILNKQLSDKGYKADMTFEIYDMNQKTIYFVTSIAK